MNSYRDIAIITATHCCVCRASLTDSESVEHGIGPVCSKRYYNPRHTPTPDQIAAAIGWLAQSGLPDHIIDGFLAFVDTATGINHARQASNLLVYWASAHYSDRDEVFKCSRIIRALGYVELADKLEQDRTVAIILDKGTHIEAFIPDQAKLSRDVRGIPGAQVKIDPEDQFQRQMKRGTKVGWVIPSTESDHFETVLGVHAGGELVCGTLGLRTIPPKRWGDVLKFRQPAPPTGTLSCTTPSGTLIQIVPDGSGHVGVYAPFNASFKDALKAQVPFKDRQWTGTCWTVNDEYVPIIKTLVGQHFGAVLS